MADLLDGLDLLAGELDYDGVERAALVALERGGQARDADLWRYISWARFESGRLRAALAAARQAEDALYEAKACFHLWRFEEAAAALERFAGFGEDAAEAEWYRGLIEEFSGRDAHLHFQRAVGLAPTLFALPARLSDAEVDAVMSDALHSLPAPVAEAIRNTVVEIRPLPAPHQEVDPLALGLYTGVDRMRRSFEDAPMLPAQIEIYRLNIERIARNRPEAVDELRITLLHEVGHHLGFDEAGVDGLGLA